MLSEEQLKYKNKYKFANIPDALFVTLFNKAKESENFQTTLQQYIYNYLHENMNLEVMQNYIDHMNINPKLNSQTLIEKISSFFAFLRKLDYTLTDAEVQGLLELDIFQKILDSFVKNTKNITEKNLENIHHNDQNFKRICDLYAEENSLFEPNEEALKEIEEE